MINFNELNLESIFSVRIVYNEEFLPFSLGLSLGHSHRKMTLNIDDGIEYVNNPLGYVRERQAGSIAPPHELYRIDWQTLVNKPE